jgi:DNA modification methylase
MEMTYKLYCGDSAQVLQSFESDSVDLTVTSPPYDNLRTYDNYTGFDFETIAQQLYRVTKPGGVVVWVVGDATVNGSETGTSFRQALYFMGLGFNCETMIYEIMGTGAKGSNDYYWQSFEFMFVLSKGKIKTSNRLSDKKNKKAGSYGMGRNDSDGNRKQEPNHLIKEFGIRSNVWEYHAGNNGEDTTAHPAPFPEALARDHILSWSNPGDLVLDPFLGSGTSGKMAIKYQRRFVGIEISQKYLDIAERRIRDAAQQPPLFAA